MQIAEEKHGPVAVLAVEGRIDTTHAGELETALLALIDRGETTIVLDFAEVNYISSAGLRVLLVGAKKMKAAQGSICLASLQKTVKDVLAVTGFMNLFRLFKSKESAVQELTTAS